MEHLGFIRRRPLIGAGNMIIGLALAGLVAGCGDGGPARASNSPQTAPEHNYAMRDDAAYGYESVLTDEDRRNGIAAKPLLMVSFAGEKDGKYQLFSVDGDTYTVWECSKPCDFMRVMVFNAETHLQTERIRAEPGTLAQLAMQDAMRGKLNLAGIGKNGKAHTVWFDESGMQLTRVEKKTAKP